MVNIHPDKWKHGPELSMKNFYLMLVSHVQTTICFYFLPIRVNFREAIITFFEFLIFMCFKTYSYLLSILFLILLYLQLTTD